MKYFHVMQQSSKFDKRNNYVGFILYQYDEKNEWELNEIQCKSGYIYLVDTDVIKQEPGNTVHNKAYYYLFKNRVPPEGKLVASGFSFQKGKSWVENSGTFNSKWTHYTLPDTKGQRTGVTEMDLIIETVENWSKGNGRDYKVDIRLNKVS